MTQPCSILPKMVLAGGVAFGLAACAPQPNPPAVRGAVTAPTTGSALGVNTHNSEPMPSGMRMQGNGIDPGTAFSSDRNVVPATGNAQGANTHNSQPMPSGMRMQGDSPAGAPMTSDPSVVPRTGSAQGSSSTNSQPMPSGMVMPNAPARY